ncbi:hypothetical protein [Streptomyces sp. DSM 40907]|uniref:hypothetical protein n=1 Tax=Streptomyces kutzneri TaxID=3051179 RepID=UPI0028D5C658|nr:hypothetical protein [Streptomyces sp. DSM 40907]
MTTDGTIAAARANRARGARSSGDGLRTAGATNAGLYPAAGLSERLVDNGLFPPLMARKVGVRVTAGLLYAAAGPPTSAVSTHAGAGR